MSNKQFSILIPTYKSQFLSDAIESCLQQTYNDYEIIIVDDASPENISEVVNKYEDKRIKYFRNEKNCGAINVVDNWNICLSHATGDYVICIGDDDMLLPNCLDEYNKLIDKYPNLGVYHAWTEIIDEEGKYLNYQSPRPEYEGCLSLLWNRWYERKQQFIGDFCFKTDLLRKDGGFYKLPLAWGSDDISAVRAAQYGGIANTQTPCFQYRINKDTITQSGNNEIKMEAILQEQNWYEVFLNHYSVLEKTDSHYCEIEQKYLKCLVCELEQHFKEKKKATMINDMANKLSRVVYWMSIRRKYDISTVRVLYSFFMAICSLNHGK